MDHIGQFFMNHWELCTLFLVIALLALINEYFSQQSRPGALSPEKTVEKINHEDATIFDIRDVTAFQSGHIINSIRVEEKDFSTPRLLKYKTKPFILVCNKGIQTQALALKLKKQGYTEVMILAGGIDSWRTAGLPLIKGNK